MLSSMDENNHEISWSKDLFTGKKIGHLNLLNVSNFILENDLRMWQYPTIRCSATGPVTFPLSLSLSLFYLIITHVTYKYKFEFSLNMIHLRATYKQLLEWKKNVISIQYRM